VIASGALGFDGKGWFWERPLVRLGLIELDLFTVVLKTLTLNPRRGNLQMRNPLTWLPCSPWGCVKFIPGGVVNKVGLSNKGFYWWCKKIAPKINFDKRSIVVSIWGARDECVEMARELNRFNLTAIEWNDSCPNTGHALTGVEASIETAKAIKAVSRHPIIAKVSVDQDYLAIARELVGVVEAFDFNSVKMETVFPEMKKGPLWRLERRVGGGGGGVSGEPAQIHNWRAVEALAKQGLIPVIAPSIMEYGDMCFVRRLGARAVSFGAIHLASHSIWLKPWTIFTNPCKPTSFVRRENS